MNKLAICQYDLSGRAALHPCLVCLHTPCDQMLQELLTDLQHATFKKPDQSHAALFQPGCTLPSKLW